MSDIERPPLGHICRGYAATARKHLPPCPRDRRQSAVRQDHHGRPLSPVVIGEQHTQPSAPLPRCHARAIPMGSRCQAGQGRSDRRREEPAADRRAMASRRGPRKTSRPMSTLADRDAATGVARRAALHRPASWRCCAVRTAARPQRHRHASRPKRPDTVRHIADLAVLAETLAAGPCGDLTFIAGAKARPLTKEVFRQSVSRRHAARPACQARRMASARSRRPGGKCRRDRRAARGDIRLAGRHHGVALYAEPLIGAGCRIEAMHKLENEKRTSIVAPKRKVRHSERKDK